MKYINIPVFIIAFFIGMLLAYIYIPPPKIVYKFPNPNAPGDVYQLDNGTCFSYKSVEVPCPYNPTPLPIQ